MIQLIINNLGHREIICSTQEIEGSLIYCGHKLAVKRDLLPFILQHWFDKFHNKFHFVDYTKWYLLYSGANLDRQMTSCFFSDSDNFRGLEKSYGTLLDLLEEKCGNFKKINIVEK